MTSMVEGGMGLDQGRANQALAAAIVDEWACAGLTVVALSPGSRSTPLALAVANDPRLRLEVFLDERSASFFALGAAKASGRPAAVMCTSGTAAAEMHPAVAEAATSGVPLIVVTADRPGELRGTGAPQTIDQVKLFGDGVRWFVDVPAPGAGSHDDEALVVYWRGVAARAWGEAGGGRPGPVHLNIGFREPLVSGDTMSLRPPRTLRAAAPPARVELEPAVLDELAAFWGRTERGLLVAGWGSGVESAAAQRLAGILGWPLIADPLSGLRCGPLAVSTYDALARSPGFRVRHQPELVVSLGAPLTSATTTAWFDTAAHRVLVDPKGAWRDPGRSARQRLEADAGPLIDAVIGRLETQSPESRDHSAGPGAGPGRDWLNAWMTAEAVARAVIDEALDGDEAPVEGRVARDLVALLPDGATLVVGSSMPVRDVESFAVPRDGLRILANRGANGIDGFVSTVFGVAAAVDGPVLALCGDLTFLHDSGGLLRAAQRRLDVTFVVVDNDGGGIFSFLPQADSDNFEALFATPHGIDLVALAGVHGLVAHRVNDAEGLVGALTKAKAPGGVRVVVVSSERRANAEAHRRVWSAVSTAIG